MLTLLLNRSLLLLGLPFYQFLSLSLSLYIYIYIYIYIYFLHITSPWRVWIDKPKALGINNDLVKSCMYFIPKRFYFYVHLKTLLKYYDTLLDCQFSWNMHQRKIATYIYNKDSCTCTHTYICTWVYDFIYISMYCAYIYCAYTYIVYIYVFNQSLHTSRIWHNINSFVKFNRFEVRIFPSPWLVAISVYTYTHTHLVNVLSGWCNFQQG